MFEKNYINHLVELGENGDNHQPNEYWDHDSSLRVRLVSAKICVDRWNMLTTDLILHTDHKELFVTTFGQDLVNEMLWGMKFHYQSDMPKDKGIIFCDYILNINAKNSKAVCVFPINIKNNAIKK